MLLSEAMSKELEYSKVHNDVELFRTQFSELYESSFDTSKEYCIEIEGAQNTGRLSFSVGHEVILLQSVTYQAEESGVNCDCSIQRESNRFSTLIGHEYASASLLLYDYFGDKQEILASEYEDDQGYTVKQFGVSYLISADEKASYYDDFYKHYEKGWEQLEQMFNDNLAIELTLENNIVKKVWVARGFSY